MNDIISLENLNFVHVDGGVIVEHGDQVIAKSRLCELIDERCGQETFVQQMRISEERLLRLLRGDAELRQGEMVRAAKILRLCSREFTDCFF